MTDRRGLSLQLHAAPTAERNRPLNVAVEVRNSGSVSCLAVGVVDGSESALRYPHYRPAITRDGVVVADPGPPEDPLVGPLRAVDFVRLEAGAAFDPTAARDGAAFLPLITFANFTPIQPGEYLCTLELSTASGSVDDWLGVFGQDAERDTVVRLIAEVPRTVIDARLRIEVR